ncbi:MAG: hypothetical protein ACK5UE_08500 [Chitinophagales bacterium]|jgi:hypothetical protein|nr:hypothetical protein [Sphingobacteriales bacterium]
MSKALIYAIIVSVVTVTACVTYFFPTISDIHSYLTSEGRVKNKEYNSIDTISFEPQRDDTEKTTASFVENPRVNIEKNSIDANANANFEGNPLKTEIIQDEIPVNKSF